MAELLRSGMLSCSVPWDLTEHGVFACMFSSAVLICMCSLFCVQGRQLLWQPASWHEEQTARRRHRRPLGCQHCWHWESVNTPVLGHRAMHHVLKGGAHLLTL